MTAWPRGAVAVLALPILFALIPETTLAGQEAEASGAQATKSAQGYEGRKRERRKEREAAKQQEKQEREAATPERKAQ